MICNWIWPLIASCLQIYKKQILLIYQSTSNFYVLFLSTDRGEGGVMDFIKQLKRRKGCPFKMKPWHWLLLVTRISFCRLEMLYLYWLSESSFPNFIFPWKLPWCFLNLCFYSSQNSVVWLALQQQKAQNLRAFISSKLQSCLQTNLW